MQNTDIKFYTLDLYRNGDQLFEDEVGDLCKRENVVAEIEYLEKLNDDLEAENLNMRSEISRLKRLLDLSEKAITDYAKIAESFDDALMACGEESDAEKVNDALAEPDEKCPRCGKGICACIESVFIEL